MIELNNLSLQTFVVVFRPIDDNNLEQIELHGDDIALNNSIPGCFNFFFCAKNQTAYYTQSETLHGSA